MNPPANSTFIVNIFQSIHQGYSKAVVNKFHETNRCFSALRFAFPLHIFIYFAWPNQIFSLTLPYHFIC